MKYAADGTFPLTIVSGTSPTGLFNADGSMNAVFAPGNKPVGFYHPCGAAYVTVGSGPGAYAPDGSLFAMAVGAGYALLRSSTASYVGPGDVKPGAYAWWGLRAYSAASIGTPAVDIIRASDSATQTFSTIAGGGLSTASIAIFLSGTTGKVSKLYDQTGNGRHLTQATSANQPDFIPAHPAFGNQRPAMKFLRANSQQLNSGAIALSQTTGTFSCVGMRTGVFSDGVGLITAGGGNGWGIVFLPNADQVMPYTGSFNNVVTASSFSPHRFNAVFNGASSFISTDGVTSTPISPGTGTFDTSFNLGNGWGGGRSLTGMISEGGFWSSILTSPEVQSIDANQKNYWFPKRGTAYEGLVALRCRRTYTGDNTKQYIMSRSAHIATEALTSVAVGFGGSTSATITASVEYPAGTFTQLKFNGSATGTVEINSAVALISDYASVSIPNGSTFWVRQYYAAASASVVYNTWQNTFLGEALTLSATALTDLTMSGSVTNSGAFSLPPALILGVTTNPSLLAMGDSICTGQGGWGDVEDSSNSATGFNARVGSVARGFPAGKPFVNWGEPSISSPETEFTRGVAKFSHVYSEYGVNNFKSGGGNQTYAQLVASTAGSLSLAQPNAKLYQTTITPWSVGTPDANDAQRVAFNDALRAGATGLPLDGYLEVADVLESSRDSGNWNASLQQDVGHPNLAGYTAVQAANLIPSVSWS